MGQSAGAHIAACALLEQATKESKGETISWKVSQIKAYFGLSGGYFLNFAFDFLFVILRAYRFELEQVQSIQFG